jgi:hypothetical protein
LTILRSTNRHSCPFTYYLPDIFFLACEVSPKMRKNNFNGIFYYNIPVKPNLAIDEISELRILEIPLLFLATCWKGTCCRNLAN